MPQKKLIIIIVVAAVILLGVVSIGYFLKRVNIPTQEKNLTITDNNIKALKSVILGTDKPVYGVGENIVARVLIKNEFKEPKTWDIIAEIVKQDESNKSSPEAKEQQKINLNPEQTKKIELNFSMQKNSLLAGQYKLELSVLEDSQAISLKTDTFEVK